MKTLDADFVAALSAGKVGLSELYTVTLASGTSYYFTNNNQNITWNGITYSAFPVTRQPITVSSSFENAECIVTFANISGPLYNILHNNVLEGATLTVTLISRDLLYAVNREIILFSGFVDVAFNSTTVTLSAKHPADLHHLQVPRRLYEEPCTHTLYDAWCGLNANDYVETDIATAGTRWTITKTAAADCPMGEVWVLTGNNAGQRRQIRSDTGGIITVLWPFVFAVEAGDTFKVFQGCPKTKDVCKDRFNNLQNFAGFLNIPTAEDVM